VQVHEQWCHMVELARISCESCCSIQHGLNPIKVTLWHPARATLQLSILDSASRGSMQQMQHICLRTLKHELYLFCMMFEYESDARKRRDRENVEEMLRRIEKG